MNEKTTTPEKVEEKKPKGAVYTIKLKDGRKIYLSEPVRLTVEAAMANMNSLSKSEGGVSAKSNMIKAGEIIINSCRVGGVSPTELEKEFPQMFCSACIAACEILDMSQAELEEE